MLIPCWSPISNGSAVTCRNPYDHDTETRARQGTVMPDAAVHECLICGEQFPLTQENHDGYGIVCPYCDALN